MTKQDMVDKVKFTIGLQDIAGFDETGFIEDELYNGTVDLLARTRCVVRCLDLGVKAGEDTYQLAKSVLSLVDLDNGARRRTRRDEVRYDPTFTLIRSDVLRIAPVPTEDGTVQTWAVLLPAPMVAPTDSPGFDQFGGIPVDYQDAIVTYALWKCADYADDASAQQGERYRMLYEGQDGRGGRLAQIKLSVNKRGTARAPGRRVRLRGVASRGAWAG